MVGIFKTEKLRKMLGKFSCNLKSFDCVIPLGKSDEELTKAKIPHNCLECEHYEMELPTGETINYRNYGNEVYCTEARQI